MNKKNILPLLLVTILVGFIVLVLALNAANSTLHSPNAFFNYSSTFDFNATSTVNLTTNDTVGTSDTDFNVSLFCNATGGTVSTASTMFVGVVSNTTQGQYFFNDSTMTIPTTNASGTAVFSDARELYNCSAYADNKTDQNWSVAVQNITLDRTAPPTTLLEINSLGNYQNFTGASNLTFNVSVNDTIASYMTYTTNVYFNVTNNSGAYMVNWTTATNNTANSTEWAGYFNFTGLADGYYNLTAFANDSVGNLNNSEVLQFAKDSTNPVVTLASINSTRTTLGISIGIEDITAMNAACTTSRGTVSGDVGLGNQVLVETALSCGTTYAYTVTCVDSMSNSGSSSETSFTTEACASSGVGGTGGSGGTTWTNTFALTKEQFEAGSTKQLSVNNRFRVTVGASEHHIGVTKLTASTATIEIASDPKTVELEIGGESKIDVLDDGYYDVYVKLNSIINNKADVTIQEIHEEIPAGGGPVTDDGVTVTGGDIVEGGKLWLWIVIGVVVLIIIGSGVGIAKKKR